MPDEADTTLLFESKFTTSPLLTLSAAMVVTLPLVSITDAWLFTGSTPITTAVVVIGLESISLATSAFSDGNV